MERLTEAVKICASTPFLTGQNDRHWWADFDWLITNNTNLLKVLEGKYSDAPRLGTAPASFLPLASDEPVHEFRSNAIPLSAIRQGLKEVTQ